MPFEIAIDREFSASHQLRLPEGALEPLHGHNWRVRVTVGSRKLDVIGVVMDFHELERLVDEIVVPMHNRHLNELSAFATRNPSAENVAVHVMQSLRIPPEVRLERVDVWETRNCRASFIAESL